MGDARLERETKQYTVYITDQNDVAVGSGVLFYAGGDILYVFTCAHVVDDLNIVRLCILNPVDVDHEVYQTFIIDVPNNQIHYSPLDKVEIKGDEKVHSEDFVIIRIRKPESLAIKPTKYLFGDASSNIVIYTQGYPNGVPTDCKHLEYLECFHGNIVVSIPNNNRFSIRITDHYIDAGNRVYELKGISGAAVWDGSENLDNQTQILFGIISCAYDSTAFLSKVFAVKLNQIRTLMKDKFGITIERKITDIPEEDIAGGINYNKPIIFDGVVIEDEQLSESEQWLVEMTSVCRCYIDGLQLQKAIDTAKDTIDNKKFLLCSTEYQKRLMQYLLYCYEICDLDDAFGQLEEDMRKRNLLKKYDVLRHMTRSFMHKDYAETISVAEEYITNGDRNKELFTCANVFLILAQAYENKLPKEDSIGQLINEQENFIFDTKDDECNALIYQMIGYVYGDRYHDYVNAVRYLNRSYRIGFDNVVLESLGAAYYFLGIDGATREDDTVDMRKVDRKALYKARECFLIVIQKADELFWAGTMRRVGLCIYNTFVFLDDHYRILTIYPDVKKYILPPKGVEDRKFWCDIEMKYARIVAQSGNINTIDYPHISSSDRILLDTIAMTSQCSILIERAIADLNPKQIKVSGLEEKIKDTIRKTEQFVRKINHKDRLSIYVQLMNMYGRGIMFFGWNKIDKLKYCLERIQNYGEPDITESMENFMYEFEAPIDEVIQRFINTFEKKKNIINWQELNHLYVRHGMMDKADAMYKELLSERKELIAEEPEYAYRAYIDYVTMYHRDLKDAIQCYLDAKETFQDTDISGFWELELMAYSNTFNNPQRFELERIQFLEKGLITEEQFHRTAFIAYMVNLDEDKAREHNEYIRQYPHPINPITNTLILQQEEIQFLNWIGAIKPGFLPPPKSMTERRVNDVMRLYNVETWHREIDKALKNHFGIEKVIAVDAWGLYIVAETKGLEFLKRFDSVFVSHFTVVRLLDELSRTNNDKIRKVLDYIKDMDHMVIKSAEFKTQMIIRNCATYKEAASAVAIGTEQNCLTLLGEPELERKLIEKFKSTIIRVNDIDTLIEW